MSSTVIWLHEKALRLSHPVFKSQQTPVVHVWDDAYYQRRRYSLKRLVFIYETMCELPVDIIRGDTVSVLSSFAASCIMVPHTADTLIHGICQRLPKSCPWEMIPEPPFSAVPGDQAFDRFFKYWHKAKRTAFVIDAGEG